MFDISQASIVEALKFSHLIGLSIGLGGAIFGDFLGLCLLFSRRVTPLSRNGVNSSGNSVMMSKRMEVGDQ